MPDPDLRFSVLDLLEPTDLGADIDRRAALPEPAPEPIGARRRVVAGLIAAALFSAAAVFAWSALSPIDDRTRPIGPSLQPSVAPSPSAQPELEPAPDSWRKIEVGATQLPAPPAVRAGDVRVWTGTQLFVWGGNEGRTGDPPHENDGWILDARTQAWSALPPSPLSPRSWAGGVWTGAEVIVWGGAQGSWPGERQVDDGAAYDPESETWRLLPPAPIATNAPTVSVWTGSEALFWGSYSLEVPGTGVAYSPSTDSWRQIPDPDVPMTESVSHAWTGSEVVVVGGNGRKRYANAAAFDPSANTWRTLRSGGFDANAVTVSSFGTRVLLVDYNKRAGLFTGDGWSLMPDIPTDSCEGTPALPALTTEVLVAELCGDLVYSNEDERWHVALGGDLVSMYAGAGEVALVLAFKDYDDPSGALYAFRPPHDEPGVTLQDAEDLAFAFAALRSNYPYDSGVPARVEAQVRAMLSASGAAAWGRDGMSALWTYYTVFEVRDVRPLGEGRFEATIRFEAYEPPHPIERIVMAPGVDLDGVERDLVIVDAESV